MFLDLDRFKQVNDTLGHAAGDDLLRLVAARLQNRLRDADMLARLAGDEFVVVLDDVADREAAAAVANDLIAQLNAPFNSQMGMPPASAAASALRCSRSTATTRRNSSNTPTGPLPGQGDGRAFVASSSLPWRSVILGVHSARAPIERYIARAGELSRILQVPAHSVEDIPESYPGLRSANPMSLPSPCTE